MLKKYFLNIYIYIVLRVFFKIIYFFVFNCFFFKNQHCHFFASYYSSSLSQRFNRATSGSAAMAPFLFFLLCRSARAHVNLYAAYKSENGS